MYFRYWYNVYGRYFLNLIKRIGFKIFHKHVIQLHEGVIAAARK